MKERQWGAEEEAELGAVDGCAAVLPLSDTDDNRAAGGYTHAAHRNKTPTVPTTQLAVADGSSVSTHHSHAACERGLSRRKHNIADRHPTHSTVRQIPIPKARRGKRTPRTLRRTRSTRTMGSSSRKQRRRRSPRDCQNRRMLRNPPNPTVSVMMRDRTMMSSSLSDIAFRWRPWRSVLQVIGMHGMRPTACPGGGFDIVLIDEAHLGARRSRP